MHRFTDSVFRGKPNNTSFNYLLLLVHASNTSFEIALVIGSLLSLISIVTFRVKRPSVVFSRNINSINLNCQIIDGFRCVSSEFRVVFKMRQNSGYHR